MGRKEYCPDCKLSVVGLYYKKDIGLTENNNRKFQYVRKAYYCKRCSNVLKDDEIIYKKIIFEK